MMGHKMMGVPTVMAEFYEAFLMDDGGPSLTLLPTMMPVGILDIAIRFEQDLSDAPFYQNTEHMTRDMGQAIVRGFPSWSVVFPDTPTTTGLSPGEVRGPDGGVHDQFLQQGHGPHFMMVRNTWH